MLARSIGELVDAPDRRRVMKDAADEILKEFTIQSAAAQFLAAIKGTLGSANETE